MIDNNITTMIRGVNIQMTYKQSKWTCWGKLQVTWEINMIWNFS